MRKLLYLLIFLLLLPAVFSHGEEVHEADVEESTHMQETGLFFETGTAVKLLLYGGFASLALILIAILLADRAGNTAKKTIFFLISAMILIPTLYFAATIVYKNSVSETGGPVHWHADYEVWACGKQLHLMDPKGLNNKIGSSTLHEHNDERIHVEGVVMNYEDVNLGNYFRIIGGKLDEDIVAYQTESGLATYENGDECPGGPGELKVFVNGKQIDDPASYVVSPEPNVPPGDCVIIDFSPGKSSTTDIVCGSWDAMGWNYENMEAMKDRAEEEYSMMGEGHEHQSEMKQGHLDTFGPGEAPHMHVMDMSAFEKVADISKAPDELPPPLKRNGSATVKINLVAQEVVSEIAPGISYLYWTFNSTIPGPFLRVREGDTIELTLLNHESSSHNHSIDLHAVTGPGGGAALTQVEPGESKTMRFKALNPGLYVYHCATPNVPMHMANGMFGMILVEPGEGLPEVDREFYVMQGELYTAGSIGEPGLQDFDADKMLYENPEYVVFNGRVKGLVENPLRAGVGEKIRLYVGNGGVSFISSFHVIGEIFDRVYPEGSTSTADNVQTTSVPAGGSSMVEFNLEVPGDYVLVDHALARLDKGAWGLLVAEGNENNSIYSKVE